MTSKERVLNACWRLNAEAYEIQVLAKGKRLKQFVPCAKAEELMAVIRKDDHMGMAHEKAYRKMCACHNNLNENDLLAYEFDPTYRLAADQHDYKMLYPRLYKQQSDERKLPLDSIYIMVYTISNKPNK